MDERLTDQTELNEAPASNDVIHLVDVSDTSQNIAGSSKKITIDNLFGSFATVATTGDYDDLTNKPTLHDAVTVTDSAEIDFTLTGQEITASLITGSIDVLKLDAGVQTSLGLADTSVQPGDNITDLNGTAHRVLYINGTGDVTELALGADGTFLKSNGASVAPSFDTPVGSGDVSKVGTPLDNQIGVWTGDGTIEGTAGLTYDGTDLSVGDSVLAGDRLTHAGDTNTYISFTNDRIDFSAGGIPMLSLIEATDNIINFGNTSTSVTFNTQNVRFNSSVSIQTSAAPTGRLDIGAGSASLTQLKLVSGILKTTPTAGNIEFVADTYYGTITTGEERKQFAFTDSNITGNAATVTTNANLTGDVTSSGNATTIANDAVTYAKMQNVVADNVILGNNAGAGGVVDELTATEVRTILNVADGANAYTHPNHTGDVTSTADGATVIAPGAVDLAMLSATGTPSATTFLKGNNTWGAIGIQVTGLTLLDTGWTLVSGLYEYDLANGNITTTSIVDVIPNNADIELVETAVMLPRTDSASGSVKVYAKNEPTDDIGVTINIFNI